MTGIHPKGMLAVILLIGGVAGVVVTKALSEVVSDLFDVWLSRPVRDGVCFPVV